MSSMKQKWFDRKFRFDLSLNLYPLIVERLRGTPARLEERIADTSNEELTIRIENSWSIQENIGHLGDLEPLWIGRLQDLMSGAKELRPADLTNAATHNAHHNENQIEQILKSFRDARMNFVNRLEKLSKKEVLLNARHPRLKQPMRTIDLVYFVAEHDDHHLATIAELLR